SGAFAVCAANGDAQAFRLLKTQLQLADHRNIVVLESLHQLIVWRDCRADHCQTEIPVWWRHHPEGHLDAKWSQPVPALAQVLSIGAVHRRDMGAAAAQ